MRAALAASVVLWVLSCSAGPPPPARGGAALPAAPAAAASSAPAPEPAATAQEQAAPAQPAAEPAACPSDMKLVDGDYCTKVEQTCQRKWHSKYTQKTICTEFKAPSKCIGDRLHKRFCIDTYEWPNVAGARPEVMNNFFQAQVKCAAVGKRLCTETEWTQACEGPELKPFPHGYTRDPRKCNGDHLWDDPDLKKVEAFEPQELARLWKGVRSGSQPECVSDYGVADMPANVDEVSSNEELTEFSRDKFDNAITGGNWYQGVRNQCRPKVYTHDDGWSYYFLGFRCCAEPDGKPTDPRAPRQLARRWEFSRVEALARFTRQRASEAMQQRQRGSCTCAARDNLCKVLCGEVLGPGAVDADPNRLIPAPAP